MQEFRVHWTVSGSRVRGNEKEYALVVLGRQRKGVQEAWPKPRLYLDFAHGLRIDAELAVA